MPRKVYVKDVPVEQDYMILEALDLRLTDRSLSWPAVARQLGCRAGSIKEFCVRVGTDDRKESGEPESEVAKWYR